MTAKAIGITDAVTTCDCCGKSNLKHTVAMVQDTGDLVHYGSTCASRNTGKTSKQINSEVRAEEERKIAAARAEYRSSPAYLAYRARLAERDLVAQTTGVRMLGTIAEEFVREAADADDTARAQVAAKHGVNAWGLA